MDFKKQLGTRINNALSLKGKMQKDLAKELGVTANTISYFCSGSRSPNIEQLIKIATFLNITTDYLLGLTQDPNITPTATDELGLSADAIYWIKDKAADPIFGAEFRDMFSKLLNELAFQRLLESLFDCAAAARAEKIDFDIYEEAYYSIPNDINARRKQYTERTCAAEDDPSLNLRVRLFIKANNELNKLLNDTSVLAAIWGEGAGTNTSTKSMGVHGIANSNASQQLFEVLGYISQTYGIPGR